MSQRSKAPLLAAAGIIAVVAYFLFAPGARSTAPDFRLQTLDGRQVSLSDYRGRPVLLTFWATTCPSCVQEIPDLIALHNEFASAGFEIIGIAMSYDPPIQVQKFTQARNIHYTIALDLNAEAAAAYKVRVTPTNVLISPDGHVEYRNLGVINRQQLRTDIGRMLGQSPEKLSYVVD